jgi:hypothetical protein
VIAAHGVTVAAVLAGALLPVAVGAVRPAEHHARTREGARLRLVAQAAPAVRAGKARSSPPAVMPIPGATLAVPTAVLVDTQGRIWIAHRPGMGVARPGGVAVHEADAWRDASSGLDGDVESLHATPLGELFASGRRAAWRWESGSWVRRLSARPCLSPLRLTSLGSLLFGVCAYYPHYVAWPTRDPGDVEISVFLPTGMDAVATVPGSGTFALSTSERILLRLPWGGDVRRLEQWETVTVPAAVGRRVFRGLWSPGPGRLVIVGTGGLVLVHDGRTWTVEDPGVTDDLQSVWGSERDGLFVVGAAGRLLHRGPGGWQRVPTGTTEPLVAVHGQPGGRVVLVGAGGAVLGALR